MWGCSERLECGAIHSCLNLETLSLSWASNQAVSSQYPASIQPVAGSDAQARWEISLKIKSIFGLSENLKGFPDQCPAQDSSSPARGWRWLSPVAGSEAPRRAAVVSLPVLVTVASAEIGRASCRERVSSPV